MKKKHTTNERSTKKAPAFDLCLCVVSMTLNQEVTRGESPRGRSPFFFFFFFLSTHFSLIFNFIHDSCLIPPHPG